MLTKKSRIWQYLLKRSTKLTKAKPLICTSEIRKISNPFQRHKTHVFFLLVYKKFFWIDCQDQKRSRSKHTDCKNSPAALKLLIGLTFCNFKEWAKLSVFFWVNREGSTCLKGASLSGLFSLLLDSAEWLRKASLIFWLFKINENVWLDDVPNS